MEFAPKNLKELLAAVGGNTTGPSAGGPLTSQFQQINFLGWFTIDEATQTASPSHGLMQHITPAQLEALARDILAQLAQSRATVCSIALPEGECWAFASRFASPFAAIVACLKRSTPGEPRPTDEFDILRWMTLLLGTGLIRLEEEHRELITRVEHRHAEQEVLRHAQIESLEETVLERQERIQQQQLRKVLEEKYRASEEANRAKTEFLSNISHELRTPLTAILGYVDLADEADDPNLIREYLSTIRRNSTNLLRIVNDILELSAAEAGRLEARITPFDPCQVAREAIELITPEVERRNLKINLECFYPIPSLIHSDPVRIRQILLHLLSNAVKFTEHGEVRIEVRWVQVNGDRSEIQYTVVDTGIGFSCDTLPQLFEPFRQGDNSPHRRFGGNGIGLSIVRRLVELLGGRLEATSTPGQGSRFTVAFEACLLPGITLRTHHGNGSNGERETASSEHNPSANPVARLHGRVLLVEDGEDNRRLITRILERSGLEVTSVENGLQGWQEAIASAAAGRPYDIILMDMQMPVMDGYQATERLRAEGWDRPIIALTAHAMPEDRNRCLQAGCDEYLAKPIRREQLLDTLRRFLPDVSCSAREVESESPS
jgi:signal transduction histidine kinase/ActR/RegA family two-component response regulator